MNHVKYCNEIEVVKVRLLVTNSLRKRQENQISMEDPLLNEKSD